MDKFHISKSPPGMGSVKGQPANFKEYSFNPTTGRQQGDAGNPASMHQHSNGRD